MSILACSDNDNEVGYLNKLDQDIKNLDVLDDFTSENKEVQRRHGGTAPYTLGDHVARYMLGPVFPAYDKVPCCQPTPLHRPTHHCTQQLDGF